MFFQLNFHSAVRELIIVRVHSHCDVRLVRVVPKLACLATVARTDFGKVVVYADRITRTETDSETGEEAEREIPFMKGYTVFNVEQIEGLPRHFGRSPFRAPRP
jgi:hypothetical protein